ncbi:hypothetical protein LguiA_027952 [Lonicera macranthoides]
MRSHNDILRSKQIKKGHAIIRVNRQDAERMRFVKSIYGEMYKDLDDILRQEDVVSNMLSKNMSHIVVLASVLEAGLPSGAVMEHAWAKGWFETDAALKEKLFGDEKERLRGELKKAVGDLVKTNSKLKASITRKNTESWWRWFFWG